MSQVTTPVLTIAFELTILEMHLHPYLRPMVRLQLNGYLHPPPSGQTPQWLVAEAELLPDELYADPDRWVEKLVEHMAHEISKPLAHQLKEAITEGTALGRWTV